MARACTTKNKPVFTINVSASYTEKQTYEKLETSSASFCVCVLCICIHMCGDCYTKINGNSPHFITIFWISIWLLFLSWHMHWGVVVIAPVVCSINDDSEMMEKLAYINEWFGCRFCSFKFKLDDHDRFKICQSDSPIFNLLIGM